MNSNCLITLSAATCCIGIEKAFELVEKVDNRWRFAKCVFSHVFDGHNFIVEINMAYVNPFFVLLVGQLASPFKESVDSTFLFLCLQRVKCSSIIVDSGNDMYKKEPLCIKGGYLNY